MLTEATTGLYKKCNKEFTCTLKTTWVFLPWALIVFTTNGCIPPDPPVLLPVLNTLSASEIHSTSVKSGGNITDDGGAAIISRGIVWGAIPSPTIEQHAGITSDGNGVGIFTSTAKGLDLGTKYYLKAYASNAVGTAYGNEIEFHTEFLVFNPDLTYDRVTDIEGNTYKTIQIGTQTWMAENLRTTKFKDGTAIPPVTVDSEWVGLSTPAYCWYDNDKTQYSATYGALYNWYTVNTDKLCPTGWHVPSNADWTILTTFLGGASVAGGQMKETGITHWRSPNTGATNSSGFTAVPGGNRHDHSGLFYNMGGNGYWWSSTAGVGHAWYRYLGYDYANVYRNYASKRLGFSVRCLRD